MNLAYSTQLCSLTFLLIEKNKEFLAALKEKRPRAEINGLKRDLADLYRVMKEAQANA